jgi:hypothetical protein
MQPKSGLFLTKMNADRPIKDSGAGNDEASWANRNEPGKPECRAESTISIFAPAYDRQEVGSRTHLDHSSWSRKKAKWREAGTFKASISLGIKELWLSITKNQFAVTGWRFGSGQHGSPLDE